MSVLGISSEKRQRFLFKNPYLFALLLLIAAIAVNFYLQPNLFELRVLNGNMRIFLPLMIAAAGQAIVIIGGGIDLSIGAMVSLVNTVFITNVSRDATPEQLLLALALSLLAGMLAGAFNGICVAYLRLQPIVTTYATSFVFAGLALRILPRPGGAIPSELSSLYRSAPLNVPLALWIAILLVVVWALLRNTRYGNYLYAVGGDDQSAYTTGVPVNRIRFSTYVFAGLFAALAAIALTMSTGTGDPRMGMTRDGGGMTLDSIVAVVLGGTRLSGGQGGIAGAVIGVAILGIIRNIISFAEVPNWWQTLVDAVIIIIALAGPGLIRLIRGQR
ncbi:MAG TPA: ABC transporter permease [Candidatus Sulfomarinibacteraceae bacterium]|nr:ABC transporter permease [Candidatus Sulfomarinibacteraceae bacterium]